MPRLAAALLLCAAALGARAETPAPPPPAAPAADGEPATCAGTLSGAARGAFSCRVEISIDGDVATLRVVAVTPVAGVRILVPADFRLAMPLRPQVYGREAVKGGAAIVELAGGDRYTASSGRGEVALVLEAAERYRLAQRFHYLVSGTLRAHLVADGKAPDEVVVDLRF